jgi:uncharacterized protein (TIGR02145 family)
MKKRFLIFFAMLLSLGAFSQVQIPGYVQPIGVNDVYPTHIDTYGQGGYMTVNNRVERNAIPAERRKIGMMVSYQSYDSVFILSGGIANTNWKLFTPVSKLDSTLMATRYWVSLMYESKISAGTTSQYWRGDKTWQTLPIANNPIFELGIPFKCGDSILYEGKYYNTIQIGTQCWFAENLNVGTKISPTLNQTNNGIKEKYCYNNLESNCDIYGGLYQWNEMMQYVTTEPSQGLCPSKWHIPTDVEWTVMSSYLGGDGFSGGKLKEVGTSHWTTPNTGATDSSGFTAVPAGVRQSSNPAAHWNYLGIQNWFWTSTSGTGAFRYYRMLAYNNETIARGLTTNIIWGVSVRCVRDKQDTIEFNNVNRVRGIFPIMLDTINRDTLAISADTNFLVTHYDLDSLKATIDTSLWKPNGLKIYYNQGNVGIGESDPNAKLEVNGRAKMTELQVGNYTVSVTDDVSIPQRGLADSIWVDTTFVKKASNVTPIRQAHGVSTAGVNFTLTWDMPFTSSNYTFTINGFDIYGNNVEILMISQTATQIVVKTLVDAELHAIAKERAETGYKISGKLLYDSEPLPYKEVAHVPIYLYHWGRKADSVTTNDTGYYEFSVPSGRYTIAPKEKEWKDLGVNIPCMACYPDSNVYYVDFNDMLATFDYTFGVPLPYYNDLRFRAMDMNCDGLIDFNYDVLTIFDLTFGDFGINVKSKPWLFEIKNITVTNANQSVDILCLNAGNVLGSNATPTY